MSYTATGMSVQEPTAAELVREVEVRHAAGASPRDIARALGLRPAVVTSIVRRAAARRAAETRTAAGIYQLKVTLEDVSPPIWPRFQVPGRISLAGLHLVLQIVMGWENDHLYQFQVGRRVIGVSGDGFSPVERLFGGSNKKGDARAVELRSVAPEKGARLTYVYDFGDNWCHEVLVERTTCPDGDPDRAVCPWRGSAPVPPRTAAASGATRRCWRPSPIPRTRRWPSAVHGSARTATPTDSTSPRSPPGSASSIPSGLIADLRPLGRAGPAARPDPEATIDAVSDRVADLKIPPGPAAEGDGCRGDGGPLLRCTPGSRVCGALPPADRAAGPQATLAPCRR